MCLVVATGSAVFGQGFNNSSFEQPLLSGSTQFIEIGPSTSVAGFNAPTSWNVVGGTVDVVRTGSGGYWSGPAAHGTQILDLTGSSNARGIIEQTINTGSQTSLNFSFSYSRNVDYNYSSGNSIFSASVRIYAGTTNFLNTSVSLDSNGDQRSAGDFKWLSFSQTVSVPQNTNITLRFEDTTTASNSQNQGLVLDFVRPVPEPTMLLASMAAVAGLVWRKSRNAIR
jgi:hypothetical protein